MSEPKPQAVTYAIRFQHMGKADSRPSENELPEIIVSKQDLALLPDVGDYVRYDNSGTGESPRLLEGRVRSRLFQYFRSENIYCAINIVIQEADEGEWGALGKD